jgi:hypothetical protein
MAVVKKMFLFWLHYFIGPKHPGSSNDALAAAVPKINLLNPIFKLSCAYESVAAYVGYDTARSIRV